MNIIHPWTCINSSADNPTLNVRQYVHIIPEHYSSSVLIITTCIRSAANPWRVICTGRAFLPTKTLLWSSPCRSPAALEVPAPAQVALLFPPPPVLMARSRGVLNSSFFTFFFVILSANDWKRELLEGEILWRVWRMCEGTDLVKKKNRT